ncbi:MAG: bifunctional adenosylcobinamide kinase/adenosylcobinamide-phosphate guanylyltransferase [Proteobacteria bacterium]|nr:bifunctional adenosylcobinamide kinase/adenosylcobinamide-phosphate guanylyltransferase [Pseudomonadota bacterium]MBU1386343.1 bifunctional adenosylcobinamide kinase/adenosylcobinamide-phosphate guanylyltransferase [Pseudomonadota bacterium]MBU1541371.1 bifunctional adenosylcobinamide kinase/adenosylcobinamide-phosphate guanylyltransferase [Pseudomonadota bacterium]MBU2482504.1 bifunctional adenosylcobinamide kinase/adenosylcobinamide-phosphate guanylyltransferase [Pseudomonadota bacterium]
MKKNITLVIGGCRSGKSSFALSQANAVHGKHKYFIATSVPTDTEMEKRVQKHQKERGSDWQTIEEAVNLHKIIDQFSSTASVILVDCLTLWASNLLFHSYDSVKIETAVTALENSLVNAACPVFLVSNEVGMGIVPENALARQFRDVAGLVNQRMAKAAHRVVMTVAGIAVQIKPGKTIADSIEENSSDAV